eukprot:gene7308-biopygen9
MQRLTHRLSVALKRTTVPSCCPGRRIPAPPAPPPPPLPPPPPPPLLPRAGAGALRPEHPRNPRGSPVLVSHRLRRAGSVPAPVWEGCGVGSSKRCTANDGWPAGPRRHRASRALGDSRSLWSLAGAAGLPKGSPGSPGARFRWRWPVGGRGGLAMVQHLFGKIGIRSFQRGAGSCPDRRVNTNWPAPAYPRCRGDCGHPPGSGGAAQGHVPSSM